MSFEKEENSEFSSLFSMIEGRITSTWWVCCGSVGSKDGLGVEELVLDVAVVVVFVVVPVVDGAGSAGEEV